MNPQTRAICIVSGLAIKTYREGGLDENANVKMMAGLVLFGGMFCLALTKLPESDVELLKLHGAEKEKYTAISNFLRSQQDNDLNSVKGHLWDSLEVSEEKWQQLMFRLAAPEVPGEEHFLAIRWALQMTLPVGLLIAATMDILEPETIQLSSAALMLSYVTNYSLDNAAPDEAMVRVLADTPEFVAVAQILSNAAKRPSFDMAVATMKKILSQVMPEIPPVQ